MRTFIDAPLLTTLMVTLVAGATVSAKPERAPVRVEFSAPAPIATGEEATTVITFRALADIDRLEVSVAPFKGLDLLSETKDAVFTGITKGEGRTITVTIRLGDAPYGYLSVVYRTRRGNNQESGATNVIYSNSRG